VRGSQYRTEPLRAEGSPAFADDKQPIVGQPTQRAAYCAP
jgi:hypothetical protein